MRGSDTAVKTATYYQFNLGSICISVQSSKFQLDLEPLCGTTIKHSHSNYDEPYMYVFNFSTKRYADKESNQRRAFTMNSINKKTENPQAFVNVAVQE